jgi:3-isopropylmalate dehydrogenase
MLSNKTLMVLPGDGVGPEVVKETLRVVDWLAKNKSVTFNIKEGLVGGASYDKYGTPLSDETLADSINADAILFGAVGGPKYDGVEFEKRPENGLLKLRKEMDLFANLRPAMVFPALVDASSLKPNIISGLDILIVRELTGGIYFAEPRGIEQVNKDTKKGYDTNLYTTPEIERIGRVAFDLARARKGKVTSVEKANVMMSGVLWREVMTNLFDKEGKEIEISHMYADNCAMQLVRDPKQFDVIVTDNLFGDILSDCAAMLTGSLGMLPSASLGAVDKNTGKRFAMYEPVHGSAPDIAGKGLANPLAELLSFSMMLRYSFDMKEEADLIDEAVSKALDAGPRTPDIFAPGREKTGTKGMMDLVIRKLEELSK